MQGWSNPITGISQPTITNLTSSKSTNTLLTIIAVLGNNFRPYSSVKFGSYSPDLIFINSEHIEFYIPSTATSGTFTVQIYNATIGSNIVTYQVDSALNFWSLDTFGNRLYNNSGDKIHLKSDVTITGNLTLKGAFNDLFFNGSSDINNIKKVTNSESTNKDDVNILDYTYTVDNLKPVKYINNQTNNIEIGFITQEIPEQYSYLVKKSVDPNQQYQSLNYTGLIGILVNEIQMLKKRVALLESK